MRWNSPSSHHQEHKTLPTASGIVKTILLLAAIVDEMELRSICGAVFHLIQDSSRQQHWFDNT